jgi:predicted dehydrogenase
LKNQKKGQTPFSTAPLTPLFFSAATLTPLYLPLSTLIFQKASESMKKLRWGFLSTAGIGRKNWVALRNAENCTVAAVASRDIERSRKFIGECQGAAPFATSPVPLGSYEELIASPEVDAVYIPVPTALRKEWVLRAARAGKHILCEKPCATSTSELEEMLAACRANGVQFMDGVMFMHHPRLGRIRAILDKGAGIGAVRRIATMFSFSGGEEFFQNNIRLQSSLEPAGCLGDLGWYCIRFALWTMNWQMPVEVSGRAGYSCGGGQIAPVPTEFSGEMVFADGSSAGFFCSFRSPIQQWAHISGTGGWLRMGDFILPPNNHECSYQLNGTETVVKCCDCGGAHDESRKMSQEANMFRNFAAQLQSGKLNEDWPKWSLKTQQVMDACLESARASGK